MHEPPGSGTHSDRSKARSLLLRIRDFSWNNFPSLARALRNNARVYTLYRRLAYGGRSAADSAPPVRVTAPGRREGVTAPPFPSTPDKAAIIQAKLRLALERRNNAGAPAGDLSARAAALHGRLAAKRAAATGRDGQKRENQRQDAQKRGDHAHRD